MFSYDGSADHGLQKLELSVSPASCKVVVSVWRCAQTDSKGQSSHYKCSSVIKNENFMSTEETVITHSTFSLVLFL